MLELEIPPLSERSLPRLIEDAQDSSPDKEFLVFPGERAATYTYSEIFDAAKRFASLLHEVAEGSRPHVGLLLPNGYDFIVSWFGCVVAGYVDVHLYSELSGELLRHQLGVSDVDLLVTAESRIQDIQPIAEQLGIASVIAWPSPDDGRPAVDSPRPVVPNLSDHTPIGIVTRSPWEMSALRFTSGTTGPSKAVEMCDSQIVSFSVQVAQLLQLDESDRLYTCFPLNHILAGMAGVVAVLSVKGTCIIDESFSASAYWNVVRRHEATVAQIIQPVLNILMKQPESQSDRDHNVTRVWTAWHSPEFEHRFGAKTVQHYSLSEGNVIAYHDPAKTERPGMGLISDRFDVAIVDDNDCKVSPGTKGEIVFRPREPYLTFLGYHNNPEATVEAWRNLWMHTGDLGEIDEDGVLHFYERLGDMVRRKGVNIAAHDIEAVAASYPQVAEAVVIPIPAEIGEFEAKLLVVPKPENTIDGRALIHHIFQELPQHMVPRYLEVRSELPRTATEKIMKRKLKEEGVDGYTQATVATEDWIDELRSGGV